MRRTREQQEEGLTKITGAVTLGDVSPAGGPRSPHRGRRVDVVHVSPGRRVLLRTQEEEEQNVRKSEESATDWALEQLLFNRLVPVQTWEIWASAVGSRTMGGNGALLLSDRMFMTRPPLPPPWRARLLSCPARWLRSNCCSGGSAATSTCQLV